MRTILMKKAAGYLVTASLAACPFVVSASAALPSQAALITTSTSRAEPPKLANNLVMARNTTGKTEFAPSTTTAKPQQTQDKKAISRCWQRLMTMVREVHGKTKISKK